MSRPISIPEYPNAAGILLAWNVAVTNDSRAPIAELATVLTGEPWKLHYADATKVVAKALAQHNGKGDPV